MMSSMILWYIINLIGDLKWCVVENVCVVEQVSKCQMIVLMNMDKVVQKIEKFIEKIGVKINVSKVDVDVCKMQFGLNNVMIVVN